jgi:LruC domain-containing protein
MKKIALVFTIFVAICVMTGVGTSCSKTAFSEEIYDSLIELKSPVDTVDPNHTWMLTAKMTLNVDVNGGVGAKMFQVLTDDPLASSDVNIIAQMPVEENDQFSMMVSYPQRMTTLYGALVDAEGRYTVTKFKPSSSVSVDFSSPIFKSQTLSDQPSLLYYAYCYEDEMPEPGDYDYNDLVMHLAFERKGEKEMRFHVKVAAVGSNKQLAFLVRLPGLSMDDIDSLYAVDDKSFNVNMHGEQLKQQSSYVENDKLLNKLLVTSKNGEPIINFFADAHWAIGEVKYNDYGQYDRKQYNVNYGTTSTTAELLPREIVFVMKVKDAQKLNSLTLEDVDPFAMKAYGNVIREIHTFPYRFVDALYENKYVDVKNLPWALIIPSGSFWHPLHGQNIGFRMRNDYTQNNEILYGAYRKQGHSFGEWSLNRNLSLDWYLNENATKSQVYIW